MQGVSKLETPNFAGNNWAMSPQDYSPEVKDYLAKLDAEAAKRGEGYYNPLIVQGEMNNGDVSMPAWATDEYLRQFINQPIEQNLGYAYAPTGKWGSTGLVSAGQGTNVVLMDDKTGEVVYRGTGVEGAQEAQRRIAEMGGKAPWSIYEAPEGTEDYYRWAQNEPQQSFASGLGQLIATVGPIVAGAALAPVAAGMGVTSAGALVPTAATAGASIGTQMAVQAAIAAGGGALQGKSISKLAFDAAKAAGFTWAAGTYGDKLMRAAGLTTTPPTIPGAGGTAGGVANAAGSADEIVINGIKNAGSGLGGVANVGSDFLRGGSGNDTLGGGSSDNEITVTANRAAQGTYAPLGGAFTGATNLVTNPDAPIGTEENPTVGDVQGRKPINDVTGLGPLNVDLPLNGTSQEDYPTNKTQEGSDDLKDETTSEKLSRYANYARLASLGVGVLGGLLGSKGKSNAGTVPKGFGNMDLSAFHGALPPPSPNMVRTPRQLPDQDWNKQGFRPAQLNYNYPNRGPGYVPPPPGQEDPRFPSVGKGYAYGGGARAPGVSLAVRGPGTDRSDSIPSMLSDGEYVIDAPTVRKIGRGNTERGFSKLDDLRVQIHRGRPHRALKSLGARR